MAIVGFFGGAAKLSVPLFPLKSLSVMGSYVGTLGQFEELMQSALEGLANGKIVGRVILSP